MQIVSHGSWRNAHRSPGVLFDGGDASDSQHRDRCNDCDPRQSFAGHHVLSFSTDWPPPYTTLALRRSLPFLKLFDGVRLISRLLRLGLIVIDVTRKALHARPPWLEMTIPTGRDARQQNVRGSFATGSRFVTGDTLEYVVGLMIKDAIRQPPLRYGGLHDHWEQHPGRRHPKVGLRSIDLRQLRSPTGTVQHMTEHTLAFLRL